MKSNVSVKIEKLIKAHGGIMLDIGCGPNKQVNFIGMDIRKLPNVDIVHDVEKFPWPIPNNSCLTVVMSHLFEHIKPWLSIKFMEEVWRVLRPKGQVAIACPYGVGEHYIQDPTHCNPVNEATFQYFDPMYPLWKVYKPKPFEIEKGFPQYQVNGNFEIIMRKVDEPVENYMKRKLEGIQNET